MKVKQVKEAKGYYAYMITFISSGNFITTMHFNFKKEAIKQIQWLNSLGIKNIALYRMQEWRE